MWCQAMGFDVCAARRSKLVRRSEEDSIRASAMPIPVYIQDTNLPQSHIPSTPSLLPFRDLPAFSITINYSFVTFNYSFVT